MRYKEIKREYPSARSACARFFLLAVAAPWRFVCALARRLGGALAPRPPPSAACARSPRGSGVLRRQAPLFIPAPAIAACMAQKSRKTRILYNCHYSKLGGGFSPRRRSCAPAAFLRRRPCQLQVPRSPLFALNALSCEPQKAHGGVPRWHFRAGIQNGTFCAIFAPIVCRRSPCALLFSLCRACARRFRRSFPLIHRKGLTL